MESIKASDLRIGNIHKLPAFDIPREGIFSSRIDGQPWGQISGYGIHLVEKGDLEFNPISLTEAWLIKFGFEQGENSWWSANYFTNCDEVSEVMIISINVESFRLSVYDQDMGVPAYVGYNVQYIHQLQNVYYALTGKEMDITL